ncbi:MAG: nuclease-related domain-containing protein [Pseudomonadota bacterium]
MNPTDAVTRAFAEPGPEHWPVYAGLLAIIAALLLVLHWIRSRSGGSLSARLADVCHDQLTDVVLPKADDGAIHIDHILLTERGIVVVDSREIKGIVFGSDRMHDWTVMDGGRRYTIGNPQADLYDRVAAVKLVVTDVPVEGRIVFGSGADFSKGKPSHVLTEAELVASLPRVAGRSTQTRKAFELEWQKLREAALMPS